MPRYEIRNTVGNALTYVDGTLPVDLMLSQAAGTYRARVMSDEQATDIVVPVLTAGSIANASPVVGDTLTVTASNAPAGATFLWQIDNGGTFEPAGGTNNAASYDTTGRPAGSYRRQVTAGPQTVQTAPVTVGAASAGITPTFLRTFVRADAIVSDTLQLTFENAVTEAGRHAILIYAWVGNNMQVADATLAGAAASPFTANGRFSRFPGALTNSTDHLVMFEADAAGAGDLVLNFGNFLPNVCRVLIIGLEGAFTVSDVQATFSNSLAAPWSRDLSVATDDNATILVAAVAATAVDYDTSAGFTVRQSLSGLGGNLVMYGDATGVAAGAPSSVLIQDSNTASGGNNRYIAVALYPA